MFEAFTQERTEETSTIEGSGLGLSIVKSLVEMMGGTIEVESVLGKGTTFTIDLAFERTDRLRQRADESAAPDVELDGRRMLLVEDNPMNTEIARMLLERWNIEVEHAVNGHQGVQAFSAHEPGYYDAVLMDIRMPVMDGYEATQRIRALDRPDAKTVPIIAMTADAYDDDVRRSFEVGMNAHVSKPIDREELRSTLERLVRR